MKKYHLFCAYIVSAIIFLIPLSYLDAAEIERPEEIKSKRLVIYNESTYVKLAKQWKAYHDAYPSEYAYANWMYAARYAEDKDEDKDYEELLNQGLRKYQANPTLLYLKSMLKHGAHANRDARRYLEQAVALDPKYSDPWFSLVIHYMDEGEHEELNLALRKLLESGTIQDEVMDFCYNMLISLDNNAIIITNGDNDTYPIWILQNVLQMRTDVTIINRSLLNSDWYPIYVIEHGAPRFISKGNLDNLRGFIKQQIKDKKISIPPTGPFCDTLIYMIINSAEHANRPVYFAKTLYITDNLKPLSKRGRDLGLVTLVTSPKISYGKQLREVYNKWMEEFRTDGLNSWRLRYSSKGDAGRQLLANYTIGSVANLDSLKIHAPKLRAKLFKWYLEYVDKFVAEKYRGDIYQTWCEQSDVEEIKKWCRQKGIKP